VKTLKWGKIKLSVRKCKFYIFSGTFPPKKTIVQNAKKKKLRYRSFTIHNLHVAGGNYIDQSTQKICFKDKNCGKKEHAIFRERI